MSGMQLDKRNVEDILSLTPMQQGMLFHYIQNPESDLHYQQMSMKLRGKADASTIEQAWNAVIAWNESLRTVFRWKRLESPVQIILKERSIEMHQHDLTRYSTEEREEQLERIREKELRERFNLEEVAFRVTWCKLEHDLCEMIVSNHHILYDGWSNAILLKQFFSTHRALVAGETLRKPMKNHYKEYIKYLRGLDKESQHKYWSDTLAGWEGGVVLPHSDVAKGQETFLPGHYTFKLDSGMAAALESFVKTRKITLASALYGAWGLVLQQYSDREDVILGTTVSGRNNDVKDIVDMVGLFINTLPLRVRTTPYMSLIDYLEEIGRTMTANIHHESSSLAEIKQCANVNVNESLFNSIMVIENFPLTDVFSDDYALQMVSFTDFEMTVFDLTLAVAVYDGIEFKIKYNRCVIDEATIKRIVVHLYNAIELLITAADHPIGQISLINQDEERMLLQAWNETSTPYPRELTLHALFERQVEKSPDSIAVQFGSQSVTFRELNVQANRLAKRLRNAGVQVNEAVALMAERSIDMIVGILGILKAGGAYMPIDPEYPEDRIAYMLEDSMAKWMVAQSKLMQEGRSFEGAVLLIDDPIESTDADETMNEPSDVQASDSLAYIIYTSGSTGRPKGTLIRHFNVSRVVLDTNYIDLRHDDVVLQLSNYAFDGSTFDIFGSLLNGSKLVLVPKETVIDAAALAAVITEQQVTVFFLTTALFNTLVDIQLDGFKHVRKVLFGGEQVSLKHVQRAYEVLGAGKIVHVYGPTESTVYATYYVLNEIDPMLETIPIGLPISNTTAYVLDSKLRPVPVGVPGELYIGGDGLAAGYLHNEELTNEKFVDHPFIAGEKIYRTGDLVRRLPDGNIVYIGRADHQVKIRGFRIEPGEIADRLNRHDSVQETIVTAYTDERGASLLCAYFVPCGDWTAAEFKRYLAQSLPEYMIPAQFMPLAHLPLTPNGKVDRKALPLPIRNAPTDTAAVPQTATENKMYLIWQQILEVEAFNPTDSFFDLGGHSLKAMRLAARVWNEFNLSVPLKELFERPTLQQFSAWIDKREAEEAFVFKSAEEADYYPASSAQKRLYVLRQYEGADTSYNIPFVYKVKGFLHQERLSTAVRQLIRRHESLRTSFQMIDGDLFQYVHEESEAVIEYKEANIEQADEMLRSFMRPFDLAAAPLMRLLVIKQSGEQWYLAFDIHHIVTDGASVELLLQELFALYEDRDLPMLNLQYKDYAVWQHEWRKSAHYQKEEQFWLKTLGGEVPVLQLATDYARPRTQKFEGKRIRFEIGKHLVSQLERVSVQHGATMYMTLLSVFKVLLHKYSDQEDIIVGTPVTGRIHPDLHSVSGMFVNTLPIRSYPRGDSSFVQLLGNVKEQVIQAYDHQSYPLEELVERLGIQKDLSRNFLFDVMFSYLNNDVTDIRVEDLELTACFFETYTAKVDLTLTVLERSDYLACEFEYSTDLFTEETILRMQTHFLKLIQQLTENAEAELSEIYAVTDSEISDQLEQLTQTRTDYGKDRTLAELFEEQVQRNARKTALVFEGRELSYGELNAMANRAAHRLRERGVRANTIVGVLSDRSPEMIVSLLAVLKAGGAYLPIDPEYPEERIRYMLTDSGAAWLVSRQHLADRVKQDISLITIEEAMADDGSLDTNPESVNGSEDVACVIYTSGSTGKPKGTLTKHANISRVVKATNYIELTEEDKLLQLSNYAFDGSTFDIYGALLNGATLVLLEQEALLDMRKLTRVIREQGITVFFITTALFNVLADVDPSCLAGVRKLLFGGEKVSVPHVRQALKVMGASKLIHVYGPTESTVFATAYPVAAIEEDAATVPIGKPISNTEAYVLDSSLRIQPRGVPGELCLSGAGLAKGYLNQPELTAERFVDHPYAPGEKLYRTGDLVRLLEDGNIEYIGRIDQQVKIRGFRIEPGEIAARLREHPSVLEAYVSTIADEADQPYLCAYYTLGSECSYRELQSYLRNNVPDYMVPARMVELDQFPLTSNGKVDRKRLPVPDVLQGQEELYQAASNDAERTIIAIWEKMFNINKVGVNNNFFELGGNSLKAVILSSHLFKEFGTEVSIQAIFQRPTVCEQAAYINSLETGTFEPIRPAALDPNGLYPATSSQKRLYAVHHLEGNLLSYNMPVALSWNGSLDPDTLNRAFLLLINRHESLRTSFEWQDDELMQRVHDNVSWNLPVWDADEKDWRELVAAFVQPFDLEEAPLLRAGVIRLHSERHVLLLDMHHSISDGASLQIFVQELMQLYYGKPLSDLPIQFKDFAIWQEQRQDGEAMKLAESYWLEAFQGDIPLLELPTDHPRPVVKRHRGERIRFNLEQAHADRLRRIGLKQGITLNMILLAAYSLFIAKYTGQEDIVIGTPWEGRDYPGLNGTLGMFVQTLPIRTFPRSAMTFNEFLEEIRSQVLEAAEHRAFSLDQLIEKLKLQRDTGRNPLFDTMFALQSVNMERLETCGEEIGWLDLETGIAKFDLLLTANEHDDGIAFELEFDTDLFYRATAERMSAHLLQLFQDIAVKSDCKLREITMLGDVEKERLLTDFQPVGGQYPAQQTLQELFEVQAALLPDSIAVQHGGSRITYAELNAKANRLARAVQARGLQRQTVVGLMLDRSIDMVVAILGVLKAGGVYLPIDPEYPAERIEYMLADSGSQWLLTERSQSVPASFTGQCFYLDEEELAYGEAANLPVSSTSDDLAYIIYTSGSTGRAKGNMATHANISRVVCGTNYIELTSDDKILQLSNYAFDGSTFDIYGALLNGAELVLVNRDDLLNLQNLSAIIRRHEISVFFVTTALFNTLADHALDCFVRVRKILFGGERVSVPHVKKVLEWIGPGKLIHVYGPTESTVFATYYPVDSVSDDVTTIPIGRPIAQTEAYIMDADLNLLPVGVKGQLCLSGEGLVQGYLNNPELTAQKFVNHPYKPGSKLYLTGDTAKWLPDGCLEYIGRMDHQVKIRGYRIEPGEITERLLQQEDVKEAIVLSRADDRGELYLCAYYATRQPIRQVDLQAFLRATLPSYMIPAVMMELERFPLTANGKIDQRALPIPERGNSDEYAAPSTVTELRLAGIIQDILSIERIGLHDNFFEAGGQSLKAMVLASRVQQAFQVSLSLKHIFKLPTLQEMAAHIDAAAETEYHSIPKADTALDYPVSSAQKRMFIIHQMNPDSILYNMPVVYEVKGSIDASRLQEAFHQLSMRHESLRTSFRMSGQEIVQQIDSCASFQLELVDAVDEEESSLRARIAKWVRPFDLGKAPLARGFVIRIAQDRHLLVLDMHHIISDGLSFNLYMNDLQKLYRGETLPEQRLQYKDYAVWQHNRIGSKEQKREQSFWLETLAGELPVLELQEDLPRPQIQRFCGGRIRTTLSSRQTKQLTMLANRQGLTPFIALFAIYNILLHKYSGQEDIIIGTPVAGRAHPDLENVAGMFVNTLPLRNYPVPDKTFAQFVDEVKARVLDAFAHQHYPLEELIEKLGVHRDLSRNPLFTTMFVWQNMDRIAAALGDAALTPYSIDNQTAKFDLTLGITEQDGELGLEWEYNSDIFVQETITRLSRNFEHLVDAVLQDPEQRIAEVEWVCAEQRSQIIETFNENKGDFPTDQTIQQFMEQSAALDPHRIVLVEGELSYTCGALNERANRLAHLIRSNGVGPNDIVAIITSRSAEMVVGILAVLKAGGAYLPIDPVSPVERTAFMLQDSCASLMLIQEAYRSMILDHCKPVIVLDPESDYSDQAGNPVAINSSEDLAYIIYTSGSTGKPKGVMVKHRSVVNTMLALEAEYPLRSGDSYMFKTTYTFDVSVAELFSWIFGQGRLVVLPDGDEKDPGAILNAIQKYCITHINFVPSMLQLFLRNASQVRIVNMLTYVFAAGEALPKELVEKLYAQSDHVMLVNLYGPTESTIYATQYIVERNFQGRVPIGKQLRNVTACIMNKHNQLVPIGVPGELCLAGEGLAIGYLNNTELTDEKFTPHPFMRGERLYRTGDMAVWRTDGMIEYLGRIDHQVKVRGYRIELEEIQSRLMEAEGISDAIVMAYLDEHEESYLCGYVVASREWTQSELRMHLITRLPAYMIPSYFVQMDKMPLTPSGKVNRKALPPANRAHVRNDGSQADFATETEKWLAMLWSEILSVEVAGAYDDFFELGGHSLKAALLTARISETIGLSLPLRVIFEKPKLKQLAEWIHESERQVQERIVPAPPSESYPATYSQTRLFVLHQFNPLNMSYNMPCIMQVKGVLDQERMYKAYAALIERHEVLRTSFEMDGALLMQRIHADIEPDYRYVIAANGADPESHIRSFIRPFDFNRDSSVRMEVLRLSQAEHLLMIDMHHIISDGISLNVFVQELFDLYEGQELPPVALQFKDYAVWQQRRLDGDDYVLQESYWAALFQDEVPLLQLPTDYARSAVQQFDGGRLFVELNESLSHAVNRLAIDENVTLFMLLLSAYYTLLYKYSGQEDIVVGVPSSSRPDSELQRTIGMFVNTLAIRAMPEDRKTFRMLLAEVKEAVVQAHEHRDYPLEKLIERLGLQRDMGRSPLFDTMFTIQSAESDVRTASTITCEPFVFHHEYSKFDLTVGVMDKDERLTMEWEYNTALFKRSTVARMAGHFVRLLEQIVHHPELRLSEADIVTEQEREQLLRTFNDTSIAHPTEYMVHQHFEQQVERVPDRPAVVWRGDVWTYRELNERANRIAHALRRRGATPDAIVAILMERSPDMIAGVLGILKSGAAYMPIDPDYPKERIAHMLSDSGTELVLTHRGLMGRQTFDGTTLDLTAEELNEEPADNPAPLGGTDRRAYVIYTSGSTGQPKGVVVTHRSLTNLACWHNRAFELTEADRSTKFAGFGFDASVWEVFPYLIAGASLYVIHDEIRMDARELNAYYERNGITISFLPTQFCEQFMELENRSLRVLLTGGDKLKTYRKRNYRLVNNYGPTENTVVATSSPVEKLEWNLPIGRPIDNVRAYIVGRTGGLQPIGVPGELCLAGDGLAQGYLNREELTAEKFIDNPFEAGGRMYRTGDLAKWLEDGNIAYMGRIDSQIKIRGYRIEPGEIAQRLLEHDTVDEAAVVAKEQAGGEKQLVAYIAARQEWSAAELRNWLAQTLPDYMIPRHMVAIERMPVTANGKINELALPEPNEVLTDLEPYLPPRNEIEALLVQSWQDVLGRESVGIRDNFFELGGDSIKAIQIAARLNSSGLKMEIKDLFQQLTIEQLSGFIKLTVNNVDQGIVSGPIPLTPIQAWFFEQGFRNRNHWNQAMMLYRKKRFLPELLRRTLDKLVEHHDALRMSFEQQQEGVAQVNRAIEGKLYSLDVYDMIDRSSPIDAIAKLAAEMHRGIDVENGPLVKAGLFQTAEGDHLLLVIHHLVVDGVSWRILLEDLAHIYRDLLAHGELVVPLPDKTNSYQAWSNYLHDYANSPKLLKELPYWEALHNRPAHALPRDFDTDRNEWLEAESVTALLTETETFDLLNGTHHAYHTEINDLMLSALGLTIQEWTGQSHMLVQMEGHGREELFGPMDMNRTVGWFTSMFPVHLDLSVSGDLGYQIKSMKEMLRNVPNKGIGYGLLSHLTDKERIASIAGGMRPKISFNYLGQFESVSLGEFDFSMMPTGAAMATERSQLLDFTGVVQDKQLRIHLTYSPHQFRKSTMISLIESYKKHLLDCVKHCMARSTTDLTPSDYGDAELTLEELDAIGELIDLI